MTLKAKIANAESENSELKKAQAELQVCVVEWLKAADLLFHR